MLTCPCLRVPTRLVGLRATNLGDTSPFFPGMLLFLQLVLDKMVEKNWNRNQPLEEDLFGKTILVVKKKFGLVWAIHSASERKAPSIFGVSCFETKAMRCVFLPRRSSSSRRVRRRRRRGKFPMGRPRFLRGSCFLFYGCGSKPMGSHFGAGAPIFRTYFSGWIESDVDWGYDSDFDPWPYISLPMTRRLHLGII